MHAYVNAYIHTKTHTFRKTISGNRHETTAWIWLVVSVYQIYKVVKSKVAAKNGCEGRVIAKLLITNDFCADY